MDLLNNNLSLGFGVALAVISLPLVSCPAGTLIGVLPGIGLVATIVDAVAYHHLCPAAGVGADLALAGIYQVRSTVVPPRRFWSTLPGESSRWSPRLTSTRWRVGCVPAPHWDGRAIGRSSPARSRRCWSPPFAPPPLSEAALKFGPADYFLADGAGPDRAVAGARFSGQGYRDDRARHRVLGMVGTDVNSGVARFSFDTPELTDGIGFVAVAMGIFSASAKS